MQESMEELEFIPETTPKGKGMTGNHSLVLKQLWINETDLAPIGHIQIANDRDTNHTLQNCLLLLYQIDKTHTKVMDR